MTAKEYLSQYRETVMEIRGIERSVESLRLQATSITVSSDSERVQSSGDGDKVGSLACQISDLDKTRSLLNCKLKNIAKVINSVTDSRYRTILRYRYIALYNWDKISEEMRYEKRYILKLHGQALKEVEETLKNGH